MGSRSFWLRVLNVYPEEWNIVKNLYIFQFLQGAGIAFFFTSAFSRFLEKFPITQLPWVMVGSAVLLWLTGFIYTQLEHRIRFSKLSVGIIVFMAGSILLLWAASFAIHSNAFYYLVIAWFEVLYLLNNMEFWGIASMIFDLRQSKRLFGVISAGDIPAKFIGYTLAWFFVPYTGTQNLLLIGAACILSSLFFFKDIVRLGRLELHEHTHDTKQKKHSHKFNKIVANIAASGYVRRIAFISLIATTCVILINYGFYGEVKKAYHDDVALAKFISFFYAGLRMIAFVTKMIFTSRLTSRMGVKSALFITPVGMLLLIGLITLSCWIWPQEKLIFYLFGVAAMLIDVLRTSFNSPVLLTLMQPLSVHERLRAHNIVKGIMDPFAAFLSGAFLLALFYMHSKVDLTFLSYVLLALGALWVLGVMLVNRQYLQILYKTLGSRFFSTEEFDLSNDAIIQQVKNKLSTGTELEVINILRLIGSKRSDTAQDLIMTLLDHPSDNVKLEALRIISYKENSIVKNKLNDFLQGNAPLSIKAEAVKALCKLGSGDWNLAAYLADDREEFRKSAMAGLLTNKDERMRTIAEAAMQSLLNKGDDESKSTLLSILNEVKDEYESPVYILLLKDRDVKIRGKAIKAAGKALHDSTLLALLEYIQTNEKQVLSVMYDIGNKAVPVMSNWMQKNVPGESLRSKIILLFGKIGGSAAEQHLLLLLKTEPAFTSIIIKALHRCRYQADPKMVKQLELLARTYLVHGVELLHMQQRLEQSKESYEVLNESLHHEIQEIREVLLCLFGCLYEREKISQVKNGLNMKHRDSVANAMEIIELTVQKDIGRSFNLLFEPASIDQRCAALRGLLKENVFGAVEPILDRILAEKPVQYYDWTKACAMYISKKYDHVLSPGVYKAYTQSDNKLLKETAIFAMATA